MGLKGILTPRGVISGSWQTFNGNYNKLTNKPTLNGVVIEGDKTSEDYHIDSGGGGGGGTTDYNDLNNKPQINDVTLSGNKSLDALGIQAKIGFPQDSSKYLDGEGNFTTPPSGGGAFSVTNLWSYGGVDANIYWSGSGITLNDSILNYDEVVVEIVSNVGDLGDAWRSSNQYRLIVDILVNALVPYTFTLCSYSQRSSKFVFTDTTITKNQGGGSDNGIVNVYGVKYH